MPVIEKEIMQQGEALVRSAAYMKENKRYLAQIFTKNYEKIVFMGCGSSYMLAWGAAQTFAMHLPVKAVAVAGGDYILDPSAYSTLTRDALIVCITRSGKTSEISRAVDILHEAGNDDVLCIHSCTASEIPAKCRWEIDLHWAFDESVCQTRNISNFYLALIYLCAIAARDEKLEHDITCAAKENSALTAENRAELEKIGAMPWNNAIVLADGELCGVAKEGALAFNEICMRRGEYFNLLDFRHGPMVLLGAESLVIAVVRPQNRELQEKMICDMKDKGAYVLAISDSEVKGADHTMLLPSLAYAAWGINMIFAPQMCAYAKAISTGHDPDRPDGLNAFIRL